MSETETWLLPRVDSYVSAQAGGVASGARQISVSFAQHCRRRQPNFEGWMCYLRSTILHDLQIHHPDSMVPIRAAVAPRMSYASPRRSCFHAFHPIHLLYRSVLAIKGWPSPFTARKAISNIIAAFARAWSDTNHDPFRGNFANRALGSMSAEPPAPAFVGYSNAAGPKVLLPDQGSDIW